jgi:hypothetical protein
VYPESLKALLAVTAGGAAFSSSAKPTGIMDRVATKSVNITTPRTVAEGFNAFPSILFLDFINFNIKTSFGN